jgi:hypothetical protein
MKNNLTHHLKNPICNNTIAQKKLQIFFNDNQMLVSSSEDRGEARNFTLRINQS